MLKQDLTCRALFQSASNGHQHQDRQGAGPRNPPTTRLLLQYKARGSQRLCNDCASLAGSKAAPSQSSIVGARGNGSATSRSRSTSPAPCRRIFHARQMKPPGGAIIGRDAGGCDEPASHATAYRSRSAIVVLWK